MIDGWVKYKLSEITSKLGDGLHGTPKYDNNGEYFFVNGNNLDNGKIVIKPDTKKVNFSEFEKYKKELNDRTILLSINGTLGNIAYYNNEKIILGKSACYFNLKKEFSKDFIRYVMSTNSFKLFLENFATGATIKNVSLEAMRNFEFYAPELHLQQKIANILSNYDNLIENNNKRIKILEEMAQKIYKEWFVDFKFPGYEISEFKETERGKIPNNWKFVKLNEILSLQHGYAFKSKQFSNLKTDKILVRMGNFQNNGGIQFENNTKYLIENEQYQEKYVLDTNDLVMVLSDVTREGRIIGNVGIIPKDNNTYLLNQRVAKIITKDLYKKYLLLLFNSKQFKNHCLSRADSATVLNLSNDDIYDYFILLPSNDILMKFKNTISPILSEIEIIIAKNQTLKKTRNLLLPRLISSEIDVENMEIV